MYCAVGEVLGAAVFPVQNEKIGINGLTAYLREHLAHYKVPTYIEIRDKLPVTVNGKTKNTCSVRSLKKIRAVREKKSARRRVVRRQTQRNGGKAYGA